MPAAADQPFPAKLAGHAVLPALSFFDPPADAPADLAISGKFTAADRKRVDAVGAIMGTSFISAKEAPRETGIKLPFKGQPLQGFSGLKSVGDGTFWVLQDNGYGTKANSADAMLVLHRIKPDWTSGKVEVRQTIFLHDPDKKIPFQITLEGTAKRYLTGADLDVESFQPIGDSIWLGEEFGPYLIRVDLGRQGHRLLRDHGRRQAGALARPLPGVHPRGSRPGVIQRAPLARLRGHGGRQGRPLPLPAARRSAVGRGQEGVGNRRAAANICASSSSTSGSRSGPAGSGNTGWRRTATISATST